MNGPALYGRILEYAVQYALSVWFFQRLKPDSPGWDVKRMGLAYASLLLLFPLFLGLEQVYAVEMNLLSTCLRFFYRTLIYVLCLTFLHQFAWTTNLYMSLLLTSIFTACQVPVMWLNTVGYWPTQLNNLVIIVMVVFSVCLLPMNPIYAVTRERALVLGVVVVCLLYTKNSLLAPLLEQGHTTSLMSAYLVLLHIFLLLFLVLFERYAHRSQQLEDSRIQALSNEYRLESVKNRQTAEADVRAIHHDMKNHLLLIRQMAQRQDSQGIDQYAATLLPRFTQYERRIYTGNELMDGLIGQKVEQAKKCHIHTDIQVNFCGIEYIPPTDLCTIFGNALDNAVEACQKVEPISSRYLSMKSCEKAGCVFITIQNSYKGTLRFAGSVLSTTKEDRQLHGYGLRNMKRSIEKYGGMVQVAQEQQGQEKYFVLTLIFPSEKGEGT